MKIEIEARPSYGMAVVELDKGETLIAESGAMVAMSSALSVDTTFNGTGSGGLFDFLQAMVAGLARKFLAGETLFVNKFRATEPGQQVMLAPSMVGDVVHVVLDGDRAITVQAESYLASSPGVQARLVWGGLAMLLSGEGAFFLRCSGKGDLLINSYGAIEKIEVDGGYIVDSGHVVAWEGPLTHSIRKSGSLKTSLLGGEGLVLEFKGKGTLWLQTRNLGSLVSWISPFLPG